MCAYRSLGKFRRRRGKARANPRAAELAQGQSSTRAGLKVVLLSVLFFVTFFFLYFALFKRSVTVLLGLDLPLRSRSVNTKTTVARTDVVPWVKPFVCARLISSVYLSEVRTQFTTLQAISKSYLARNVLLFFFNLLKK